MRRALSLLLLFSLAMVAGAATNIQTSMTFSTATVGTWLTDTDVDGSQFGPGTWDLSGGTDSAMLVVTNWPYRLPFWYVLGGTNIDQVNSKWIQWVPTNMTPASRRIQLQSPGGSGGAFTNGWMQGFMILNITNDSISSENYDLLEMDGSPFCVMQLTTWPSLGIQAHAQDGGSTLGTNMSVEIGKIYFYSLYRDAENGRCLCELFDPTNNFNIITNSTTGTAGSVATMEASGTSWRFWMQAHYAAATPPHTTGTNWFSSFAVGYGTSPPPRPETNVIVSDRLLTYRHGTNFGVRGVRPTRTSETLVGSPANDDNGTLINNAIAAAGQGDVILISGTNKITNSISSSGKTNFTFRGTNNAMLLMLGQATVDFGPTALSSGQADVFYPTNGVVVKGATNVTLTTNYSTVNGERMGPGASFKLSQLDGDNTNYHRAMTTSGGERSTEQLVYILTTNGVAGRDITFTPPAVQDWTNLPVFVEAFATMRGGVGIENITFALSNAIAYSTNLSGNLIYMHGLVDSWVTGCGFEYFNNYGLNIAECMFSEVNSNIIHNSLTGGTSHGGLLMAGINSCYVYDNIIYNMSPGIHSFGSDVGNVFIGNYFTNTDGRAVLLHHTGHDWNIWEQNVTEGASNGGDGSFITGDGYFGHNWMDTFYRNSVGGFSWKRIQSYHNAIGNHLADTGLDMRYDMYSPGGTYELFEMGYPNIGGLGTNGISPPTAWNFPGTTAGAYSNCFVVITNASIQVVNATNVLGVFSNWPPSSVGYTVIFQDGVNSNKYWNIGQFNPTVAQQLNSTLGWVTSSPTETGISLLPSTGVPMMPISNGWTMLIAGPTMYQQRQQIDVPSHIRHWNHIITNSVETVVRDPAFLPGYYPPSLVFSDMPSWWKTNGVACRWPAIDPSQSTEVTPIPAKGRFNAAADGPAPANVPRTGRLRGVRLKP